MTREISRVIDGRQRSGLFSVVTVVLENLILRPEEVRYRVELGPEYLYFDSKVGPNVWEYFFNQPQNPPQTTRRFAVSAVEERGFIFDRTGLLDITNRTPSYNEAVLQAAKIFRDEIGFSELASTHLEKAFQRTWAEGSVLAVHRRETDFKAHGLILPIDAFFKEVDPYIDSGYAVFLATDSHAALAKFRKRYGKKRILSSTSSRSRFGRPLHTSRHMFKSPAAIGFEALTDAYLLSRGDHLIRTRSNVTTFSKILNPLLPTQEIDQTVEYS